MGIEDLLRIGHGLGWTWCWSKPKLKDREHFDMQPFIMRRLPVFWIMGPSGCGKNTIAQLLEQASEYNMVKITDLITNELSKGQFRAKIIQDYMNRGQPVPLEIVIALMKEYIFLDYENAKGFIFCGFPLDLHQAKLFEIEICHADIIVYCTLAFDEVLGRMQGKHGDVNAEQIKIKYEKEHKNSQALYRYYENKTLKVVTSAPPDQTLMKLLSDLEYYWGYKFTK